MTTNLTQMRQAPTLAEIAERAGQRLCLSDLERVTLALAEVAAEEAQHNPIFAERIRAAYAALPSTTRLTKARTARDREPAPVKRMERRASPRSIAPRP